MTGGANHLHVHRRRKRRKYRHFIALGVEDIKPRPDRAFIIYLRMIYMSNGIPHRHINRYARTASVFYRRKPLKRKNNYNCAKHYKEMVIGDK